MQGKSLVGVSQVCVSCVILTPASAQKHQRRWVYLPVATGVPSVALPRNLANSVVALAAVLGSRSVEMPVTQSLVIRGSRASEPAKANSRQVVSVICIIAVPML